MRIAMILLLSLVLRSTTVGAAASIGLFSTPDCTSCSLDIPPSVGIGTFYISAVGIPNDPYACGGLQGAEFRVDGVPAGWLTTVTPSPRSNVFIGDPLGAGTDIAFPTRETGDCILLYTVTVIPVPPGSAATLRVLRHTTPANPLWNCPLIVPDCFEPWPECVAGGTLLVNSGPCSVGVELQSWGVIKKLYE